MRFSTISTTMLMMLFTPSPQQLAAHSVAKQIGMKNATRIMMGSLMRKRWNTENAHVVIR